MSKNKKSTAKNSKAEKKEKNSEFKKDFIVGKYMLALTHKKDKKFLPITVISSIFLALTPILNIIMPKYIIDELLGNKNLNYLMIYVGIIIVGNFLLASINSYMQKLVSLHRTKVINQLDAHSGKHVMSLDFYNVEDPDVLNMQSQATFVVNNQGSLWRMTYNLTSMIQQIIQLIAMMSIIFTLDIFIVVIIVIVMLLNMKIFNKSQKIQFDLNKELIPINRKFMYYANVTTDFSMAKDARMYNMTSLIEPKFNIFFSDSIGIFRKLFKTVSKYEGLIGINSAIQIIMVYSILVFKMVTTSMGIGDFTLYVNASSNFATTLKGLLNSFVELRMSCQYLDLYKEFISLPHNKKNGLNKLGKVNDLKIEFKNVYFKYPKSEDYILKNINITIKKGDKLSVVGLNGAGKTTFIKLICRLYHPDKGTILLNGVDIQEYDFDSYMNLISVVFQDFKLFSFSIKENIALLESGNANDEKIMDAIKRAGLKERVDKLDDGIYTSLYKNFDEKGIEFSGGENQKLAIARAIYKDSPVVILDEPTAALDPYAEYEIYHKFNKLVGEKAAIYISHRLSSCRFCDNVAVFDNGEIVEYGSHDDLVKLDGLYNSMWSAQAQYYN